MKFFLVLCFIGVESGGLFKYVIRVCLDGVVINIMICVFIIIGLGNGCRID